MNMLQISHFIVENGILQAVIVLLITLVIMSVKDKVLKKDIHKGCTYLSKSKKHDLIEEQMGEAERCGYEMIEILVNGFHQAYHQHPDYEKHQIGKKYREAIENTFNYLKNNVRHYLRTTDLTELNQQNFEDIIKTRVDEYYKSGMNYSYKYLYNEYLTIINDIYTENCGYPSKEIESKIKEIIVKMFRSFREIALKHKQIQEVY